MWLTAKPEEGRWIVAEQPEDMAEGLIDKKYDLSLDFRYRRWKALGQVVYVFQAKIPLSR